MTTKTIEDIDSLVYDLIAAAASVMQHDSDVTEGIEPHEKHTRETLDSKFREILRAYKI